MVWKVLKLTSLYCSGDFTIIVITSVFSESFSIADSVALANVLNGVSFVDSVKLSSPPK